ncbi:hypothetical protein [Paraburkholderia antibiotica]|uniref:Uncharacterized protein n=1 Tax=Paraburkholderia antibiotica TaxID=2728839 RepID=A0A7X9X1S9_9BURK|nr:hypothetical protein [Paraburkholderia antibiotica]NML29806.1 hypothetical protein [Paraburkholderia antibiotica]
MSALQTYTGDELSYSWDESQKPKAAGLFDVRPPGVPFNAKPIYDADLDCIIGYQQEVAGVSRIYGLDGHVSVSEKPLESPLFDPLDVLFMVGGFWRAGLRGLTEWGIKGIGSQIGRATLYGLRARYYALVQRPVRFSAKALEHMMDPDRFVPLHILRLAVKYGSRIPDPRNRPGLYMYEIAMSRLGAYQVGKKYVLEVLVNEKDYIIYHFKYDVRK